MTNSKEQTQKLEYFDNNFFNFLKRCMKYLKNPTFSGKKLHSLSEFTATIGSTADKTNPNQLRSNKVYQNSKAIDSNTLSKTIPRSNFDL